MILAAGMGTRLGSPYPKPLTTLVDGRTIMAQQIQNLRAAFGHDVPVMTVVGFKLELILEAFPNSVYIYNERYDQTNTSKSLLKAFNAAPEGGVLWMNGDVVFDPRILTEVSALIEADNSFICVNTASVGEEEVKYRVDTDGHVNELSKQVQNALGEAVGINFVASKDRAAVTKRLVECDDQDYFERGLELAVEKDGVKLTPVDIKDLFAVEVDFAEDLSRANEFL